jgi:hypothetical protein
MDLTRVWTPSGNYSGGGTKRILVIHTMEGFTGPNGAYDCAKYFQGPVGASSQVCIDNNRGKVWEGVSRHNASWTQCNYNGAAVSCEQSGFASWSRQYWLDNRSNQLHNIADWIAEESRALGIPITDLSASQAQGGGRGVCYHSELGSSGCGHSDPGSGWPIDKVLEWARGGTEPEPEPPKPEPVFMEEDDMPVIPPRSEADREFGISLPGPFKAMGVLTDASLYGESTHLRVAFHNQDNSGWQVIEVYSDPGHQKVVVWPKKPFDGVSIHRMDNNNVNVIPDFGK